MKKIKLINSLTALTTIGASISVLASCSCKTDSIIVKGGSYDKEKSKIELNQDSTIYLTAPKGKTISNVKNVKVGGQTLTNKDYEFKATSTTEYKLVIFKHAMTSKDIYVELVFASPTITGVDLNKSAMTLEIGNSDYIKATISYSINADSITWTQTSSTGGQVELSSTTSVSSEEIKVTGVTEGIVTLTATCGGKTASCTITVTSPVPVVTISNFGEDPSIKSIAGKINTSSIPPITPQSPNIVFDFDTTAFTGEQYGHFFVYKDGEPTTILGQTQPNEYVKQDAPYSVTLKVTTWTGLVDEDKLMIGFEANQVEQAEIKGNHNVDINDDTTWQFSADTPGGQTSFTWDVSVGKDLCSIDSNGKITLSTKGQTQGGSATITAKPTTGKVGSFDIEIATFNKLKIDEKTLMVGNVKQADTNVKDDVVLPTKYFDYGEERTNDWVETKKISASGFTASGIKSIYISKSISSIPSTATATFGSGLQKIEVDSANTTYSSPKDSNCIIRTSDGVLLKGCSRTTIPDDVTEIYTGAFAGTGISTITIPNSVTTIGESAFTNSSLTSFTWPKNVETMNIKTFMNCTSLQTIDFEKGSKLTTIKSQAFSGCTVLNNIILPASLNAIELKAFEKCTALADPTSGSVGFDNTSNTWVQNGGTTALDITVLLDNANHLTDLTTSESPTGENWGTTGIVIDESAKRVNFNGKTWADIATVCAAIEQDMASGTPTVATAMQRCQSLGIAAPTQGSTYPETLEINLVGRTGIVKLNDKLHNVRCVGTLHDWTNNDGSTRAAMTFELSNLVTQTDEVVGSSSRWSSSSNKNYPNSTLKNFISSCDTSLKAGTPDLATAGVLKTVYKHVNIMPESTWTSTTYEAVLFALTYTEVGLSGVEEGCTAYKYYADGGSLAKSIVGGGNQAYWLASPDITGNQVYYIDASGVSTKGMYNDFRCYSFAFCI